MNNNQIQNQNDNDQYIPIVNYLISQLNKAKVSPFSLQKQSNALPVFLYEFFVFELYLPSELLKIIKQPILAFRLLDFPTLTLEGNLNLKNQSIVFNQGKSSFFEMDLSELKDNMLNQPMYIMFLDLNHGNIKIIGNCRLNISLFAYDSFLNFGNGPIPEPRRNILQLFDNTMEKIGEFEMSLIIRREYYKFDKNVEVSENKKTVLVKKAKKQRQILMRDKIENLMYRGKEKPKEQNLQKEIVYDNNKISNSKYIQPQFIHNIELDKNDTAFNAHPINKEIIIKPKNKEEQKSPEKIEENKKYKKQKVMKSNGAQTGVDLIPGLNVPIDKVDYHKKDRKKKKIKKNYNFNNMNNYTNNQMLINSMYNKYQTDSKYNFPEYELRPINQNNNFNNHFNNQFNNNQNINNEMQNNQKNQINNNKLVNNADIKINNTYQKFLIDLKSQINDYTNNLLSDKKVLEKIKEERNINLEPQYNNMENNEINKKISEINDVNDKDNIINNQNDEIKKSENTEKSEKSEKSQNNLEKDINEKLLTDENKNEIEDKKNENDINNNIDSNINNENKNNNNNINYIKENKKEEIINEESKEDEEYNDFVQSGESKLTDKKNKEELLDNKFNNFNIDTEEKKEVDIQENINANNNLDSNNYIPSENDIKESSSLKNKNKNTENQVDSGEINEEIDENLISNKKQIKTSNNEEINSKSENKGIASSTEIIENLLK